jgi:hypothetical protein
MNSRLIVPFAPPARVGLSAGKSFGPSGVLSPGQSVAVNIRAEVWNPGYYLFVILSQVSPQEPVCNSCLVGGGSKRVRVPTTEVPPSKR